MDIRWCKSWEEVVNMAIDYGGDVYFAPVETFAWGTPSVEMNSVKNISIGDLKRWFEDESRVVSEMICIWPESKAIDGGNPPYKATNYIAEVMK